MKIPGYATFWARIFGRKSVYDLLIGLAAVFGGGASALRAWKASLGYDEDFFATWLFLVGSATVAVIAAVRFSIEWSKAEHDETPRDLEGCLHILHAILLVGRDDDAGLRLTLHVPNPSNGGRKLQQIIQYVGDQRGSFGAKKTAGRTFAAECGVIGEAYRTRKASVGNCDGADHDAFIHDMVTNWQYSEQSARALNPNSRAWLAVPLVETCWCDARDVVAIIYGDSTDPAFFSDEQVYSVMSAAEGIARFAQNRYR